MRDLEKMGHGSSQKIGGVKKVAEILNALSQEAPELLNADAFGDGWLARVELADPAELDRLMDAAAYADETA